MISKLEIIRAACSIYDPASDWDELFQLDGVYAGLRRYGDEDLLVCRGSDDLEDWLRDFEERSLSGLANIPKLGQIHAGMWIGMPELYGRVASKVRKKVSFGGHSLGAAHTGLQAGLFMAGGLLPQQVVVVGEPQYCREEFQQLVAEVPWISCCNRHQVIGSLDLYDPVTGVAPDLLHPHPPLTYFDVAVMPGVLPSSLHSSSLYLEGAKVRFPD